MFNIYKNLTLCCNYLFKSLPAIVFFLITMPAQGQTSTISFTGFGEIKLGMKLSELEKLLNESIATPNITSEKPGVYQDTIHIIYKGVDEDIILQRPYTAESNEIQVWMIKSNSALLKTNSGIVIGDDLKKIFNTYKGYPIGLNPVYDRNDYKIIIKGKSYIELFSSDKTYVITFYLTDEKVTGFGLNFANDEGDYLSWV